jgi:hypothetical protein
LEIMYLMQDYYSQAMRKSCNSKSWIQTTQLETWKENLIENFPMNICILIY